jgi:Flp pilus assembly protein TadD
MTRWLGVSFWQGSVAAAVWLAGLSGCQHSPQRPQGPTVMLGSPDRPHKVTARQAADVQYAIGRSLEMRGEGEQAIAAYREALKRDPDRADAQARLAILYDQQGRFDESAALYRSALAAQPGNPDLYCDMGYSLSLQHRWAEAEMNLRQAIALAPNHRRAHNNLGLVLAHAGRPDDALAEFRKGGCDEADAHVNLAFVLTLERSWPEARAHYERALALRPSLAAAQKGLEEVTVLLARGETEVDPLAPGARIRRVRGPAHDEAPPKPAWHARRSKLPDGPAAGERASPITASDEVVPAVLREPLTSGTTTPPIIPAAFEAPGAPNAVETGAETTPSEAGVAPATETPVPPDNDSRQPEQVVLTSPLPGAPAGPSPSLARTPEAEAIPVEPEVVSPLVLLKRQVAAVCADEARDLEVLAESPTSLRIRFKVRTAEDGYQLGSKVLWMPELGPYQVALDVQVAP